MENSELIEQYEQKLEYYNNLLKNPMYSKTLFNEYYEDRDNIIKELEILRDYMDIEYYAKTV